MMQQYDDDCYITINNNKLKYISYYSALDADTKYLLYQLAYPTLYLSIADKSFLFVLHFLLIARKSGNARPPHAAILGCAISSAKFMDQGVCWIVFLMCM